jgi:hypothetical protein
MGEGLESDAALLLRELVVVLDDVKFAECAWALGGVMPIQVYAS